MTERFDRLAARPGAATGLGDGALEAINRAWTVVRAFSNTAHDVNNALQVIAGSAELLEARELDPAVRRRVEIVRAEAAKAAVTINRLLSYSRSSPQPPRAFDVWGVVQDAIAMRAASAGHNQVQLSLDRTSAGTCRAMADATHVLQALLNILFTAEDLVRQRPNARILAGARSENGAVEITVTARSDEGSDALASQGGPEQADGLTVGAQMWAAAHIADVEGGHLAFEPVAGGQRFVLTLPAAT